MPQADSIHDAATAAEHKIHAATRAAITEIHNALSIAQESINSGGESVSSSSKSLFKDSHKATSKHLDNVIKGIKEDLHRATSSAQDARYDDEKVSVKEAIKLADTRFDAAVKVAHAEVDGEVRRGDDVLKHFVKETQVLQKAHGGVAFGDKMVEKRFNEAAREAVNSVRHALKGDHLEHSGLTGHSGITGHSGHSGITGNSGVTSHSVAGHGGVTINDTVTAAHLKLENAYAQAQRELQDVYAQAEREAHAAGTDRDLHLTKCKDVHRDSRLALDESYNLAKREIDDETRHHTVQHSTL